MADCLARAAWEWNCNGIACNPTIIRGILLIQRISSHKALCGAHVGGASSTSSSSICHTQSLGTVPDKLTCESSHDTIHLLSCRSLFSSNWSMISLTSASLRGFAPGPVAGRVRIALTSSTERLPL